MAGLFVDPQSLAMQTYRQWQNTDPAHAAIIYQIASQPQAVWLYGDGNGMTAAEQTSHHVCPHFSEANHCKFHDLFNSFLRFCY